MSGGGKYWRDILVLAVWKMFQKIVLAENFLRPCLMQLIDFLALFGLKRSFFVDEKWGQCTRIVPKFWVFNGLENCQKKKTLEKSGEQIEGQNGSPGRGYQLKTPHLCTWEEEVPDLNWVSGCCRKQNQIQVETDVTKRRKRMSVHHSCAGTPWQVGKGAWPWHVTTKYPTGLLGCLSLAGRPREMTGPWFDRGNHGIDQNVGRGASCREGGFSSFGTPWIVPKQMWSWQHCAFSRCASL